MVEYKLTEKFTQDVIDELLEIQKKKGLTPEQVVEFARDEDSPLHDLFEWEDSIAGEKWRLQQARVIVNEVKVIIENQEYYAFESVQVQVQSGAKKSGSSEENITEYVREYKPVVEILSNEDLKRQVISSALNHLSYWEKQNAKYSELSPIIKASEKVRKKLDKQWQKKKK